MRWPRVALPLLLVLAVACASPRPPIEANGRIHTGFAFGRDTFSFPNETVYAYDVPDGPPPPPPSRNGAEETFALRCFAMARSARQFFRHARFDPHAPALDGAGYARLVEAVTSLDPRDDDGAEGPTVVIPGYASLRDFSRAQEAVLKEELGGWWRSYVQRGNWRMIFPPSAAEHHATAGRILAMLREDRPPIVHVYTTLLAINHAVLIYAAEPKESEIVFHAYDPNDPRRPLALRFEQATSEFHFPRTHYFPGGAVKAYVIYEGWLF